MTPQDQKRLEVLQDTVKYYTNDVTLRCVDDIKDCSYSNQKTNNKKSKGCAVGRLIPLKLRKEWDKRYQNKGISCISQKVTLPENLLELGVSFLMDLQNLHDNPTNWNTTGLTLVGEEKVERITEDIQLGRYN